MIYKEIKKSDQKFLVDIVVLSYNNRKITEDFLGYLYKNTNSDFFHLIWLDNKSEDDTRNFLVEFSKEKKNISLFFGEKNYGVIGGRNYGYKFSKNRGYVFSKNPEEIRSPFLMFLDNDQFVQEKWFDQHISLLCSGYDLVGVEAWLLNNRMFPCQNIKDYKQKFSYVGCGGMVMKKEVPDNIGMFDNIFTPAYFEDPDFCIRAYKTGYKIGWNYKAKIIHMAHQTLGNLKHTEKTKIFTDSLQKFRSKWKSSDIPILKQEEL